MFKKLLIAAVIVAIMAFAVLPMVTDKMAEKAFKEPDKPLAAENVKKAIKIRMQIYMYSDARKLSEKAVMYFPESKEFPYFIYVAAVSSERSNAPTAAIHWYGYFLELFPTHEWAAQAKSSYERLKALYPPPKPPELAPAHKK